MTTVENVHNILERNVQIVSLDLKDMYWHILNHPRKRKLLAFKMGKEAL